MTRGDVGRLLTASLHQSIVDVLPTRVEFYESWLPPESLHNGRLGRAPLAAVLSFLRMEGAAYSEVASRAGQYAAEWCVSELSPLRRAVIRAAPEGLRRRLVMGVARGLIRTTFHESRARVRWRKGAGSVEIHGSVFCSVRDRAERPLCQFYAAAITHLMTSFTLAVEVEIARCLATDESGCLLTLRPK